MTDPIYRVRQHISEALLTPQGNITMGQFKPDGTRDFTYSTLTYLDNIHGVNYIKDEIHSKRTSGLAKGRYPPGYCYSRYTDLSKVICFVDVQSYHHRTLYSCRWDSDPKPLMNPAWLEHILGQVDLMPGTDATRPPASLVNALSEEAFNYFSDVLPASLSFGEFVQGFTQLQDLLPAVEESITKTMSKGYLNKKFGWDNLLSDLSTLSTLFDTVYQRMDYFRRTYGVPTRLGFSRHIDWEPYFPGNYGDPFPKVVFSQGQGVTDVLAEVVNYRATFRATAWIMQKLDFMTDLVGFLRVLAGALGLNNPVKLFWETLPLSFVVDWFFNISTHLDNLTRLNPIMGWDVNDATQSVTWEYDVKFTQRSIYDPRGSNYPVASWLAPVHVYERQPRLSFQWELLNPSELSPTQLTLLLAMLHANV